jgi:hypothetical protein
MAKTDDWDNLISYFICLLRDNKQNNTLHKIIVEEGRLKNIDEAAATEDEEEEYSTIAFKPSPSITELQFAGTDVQDFLS